MKKTIQLLILSIFSFLLFQPAKAQLTKADGYYEIEKFRLALKYYKRAFKKDSTDLYVTYQIANCYLRMNTDRSKALRYLLKIYKTSAHKYVPQIIFDMAVARFHNHEFLEAIRHFEFYKKYLPEEKWGVTNRYIDYCINADSLIQTPLKVKFINLGKAINSKSDDFNPYVTRDDSRMLFSTERDLRSVKVYMSTRKDYNKDWEGCVPASEAINASNDQIVSGLSPDGKALFLFYNNYDPENNDLVMSTLKGKEFDEAKVMPGKVNTNKREEGACITMNRDTLFFSSSRPDGYGGLDIYMSKRLPTGEWGEPVNLGNKINTPFDDNYPAISENGKRLYFSSKGHNSMGGYDLFEAEWNMLQNQWGNVKNMRYPINTTYDNNNISILDNKRYAYVAAHRSEGYGQLDIYKVIFQEKEPDYFVFRGKVSMEHPQIPDSVINIDLKGAELKVSVFDLKHGDYYGVYTCSPVSGKFIIALPPGEYEWEVLSPDDRYEDLIVPVSVVESTFEGIGIKKDLILKRKR